MAKAQQFLISYGTYDLGDSRSSIHYCFNQEEALEDARYVAQNHFESLANRNRVRWKRYVGQSIEEYRDKIGRLTGTRPLGATYNGESLWARGVNLHNGMIEDHIWYKAEPIELKNPFENL